MKSVMKKGDVDAGGLRYEYGVGNVSPDTIIIEEPLLLSQASSVMNLMYQALH